MAKKITTQQLVRAFRKAPQEVERDGKLFLQRGIAEYKRVAVQATPWRVGKNGGGIPRDTGNLREQHKTKITGMSASFGVSDQDVPYAKYVHGRRAGEINRRNGVESRPWLDYARDKASNKVEKHYKEFADKILQHLAP